MSCPKDTPCSSRVIMGCKLLTWGCVLTELDDMATAPSPFCNVSRSHHRCKQKKELCQLSQVVCYLHIERGELADVLFQMFYKWTVVAYEHNLKRKQIRRGSECNVQGLTTIKQWN